MSCQGHGQRHHQEPGYGHSHEDRADDHAADVQDEDCRRPDGHQDDRVHDPFHDHRAQRGAAADSLSVPQVVAPNQLAETGRQDVVGQIADEHVATQTPQGHGLDRGDEGLPAQRPEEEIGGHADQRQSEPRQPGAAQKACRLAQVHAPQDQIEADDRDGDADAAPGQAGSQSPHRAVGFRRASFRERRSRIR